MLLLVNEFVHWCNVSFEISSEHNSIACVFNICVCSSRGLRAKQWLELLGKRERSWSDMENDYFSALEVGCGGYLFMISEVKFELIFSACYSHINKTRSEARRLSKNHTKNYTGRDEVALPKRNIAVKLRGQYVLVNSDQI